MRALLRMEDRGSRVSVCPNSSDVATLQRSFRANRFMENAHVLRSYIRYPSCIGQRVPRHLGKSAGTGKPSTSNPQYRSCSPLSRSSTSSSSRTTTSAALSSGTAQSVRRRSIPSTRPSSPPHASAYTALTVDERLSIPGCSVPRPASFSCCSNHQGTPGRCLCAILRVGTCTCVVVLFLGVELLFRASSPMVDAREAVETF